MSYFDQQENYTCDADYAYTSSLMAVDLIALDNLYSSQGYGIDNAFSGKTTYGFNTNISSNTSKIYANMTDYIDTTAYTIVDDSGKDTLDFRGFDDDQGINLKQSVETSRELQTSDIAGLKGNLVIAAGTVIENAIGGSGDDTITGNNAKNKLQGKDGDDILYGGQNRDKIYGGDDDDTLYGEDGEDRLIGADGDDILYGGDDKDKLYGGRNDDTLNGGDDKDKLWGGSGGDTLNGDGGNDRLKGKDGDDILKGGLGKDVCYGGEGDDIFIVTEGSGYDKIKDFDDGEDKIDISELDDWSLVTSGDHVKLYNDTDDLIAKIYDVEVGDLTQIGDYLV